MWANEVILQKCEELSRVGYRPALRVGMFVGRGFADVGSEVFTVHPGGKLLSLFSGKITPITEQEEEKLFHVPTTDEAVLELLRKGVVYSVSNATDGREWWQARVRENTYEAPTLLELFLELLLFAYQDKL